MSVFTWAVHNIAIMQTNLRFLLQKDPEQNQKMPAGTGGHFLTYFRETSPKTKTYSYTRFGPPVSRNNRCWCSKNRLPGRVF